MTVSILFYCKTAFTTPSFVLWGEQFFDSDTDAAAGTVAGASSGDAAAASAAASAVCVYYIVEWGRFAPPYKYIEKYTQQNQQQKQQQHLQKQLQQQLQQQHLSLNQKPVYPKIKNLAW